MIQSAATKPTKTAFAKRMKTNRRLIFLNKPQLISLLRAAKAHSAKAHAMICTAYWHGLRTSEVCGLKIKDVDFKNRTIHLARLKGSLEHSQALAAFKGEPLLDEIRALKAWMEEREKLNDHSDALFVSQKHGEMDRSTFFRLFRQIAVEAGLPEDRQHPRILKHSLASHMISDGVNLAVVAQSLGHMALSSTYRYTGVSDETADDARQKTIANMF